MSKIEESNNLEEYNISPNFEYEEDIVDDAQNTFALIDSFEAFMSISNGKPYIIYQNKNNLNLEVLKVLKNKYKLVTSIKGHDSNITFIKYFLNKNKKIEYLISSDYNGKIIIINISENYKKECAFKTEYENGEITCCLMIFKAYHLKEKDIKNGLFIISNKNSHDNQRTPLKLYILDSGNLKYLNDLYLNQSNNSSYLLHWDNKKNKNDYLIDIGYRMIDIIGLEKNDLYASFMTPLDTWYHCGLIYNDQKNKRDLLYVTSIKSNIYVFNLDSRQIIKEIRTSGRVERLYSILQWNSNFILASNATAPDIKVIDINQDKYVGNNFIAHEDDFRCIRKIKHPKFGYCIITGGDDSIIKLYKSKCI